FYSLRPVDDAVARRLKQRAAGWVDASVLDDAALAARLRADAIDIAVDLAGHTPGHRLAMFAHRPAPLCIAWLDYFDTTGLATMDYLVTDRMHSPNDDAQRFTERLLRLARIRLCYEPIEGAPDVVPPPLTRGEAPVLGSFNRLAKISTATLDAWCAALEAVPQAHLVIKNSSLGFEEERALVRSWFADRGIEPARLRLRGFSSHLDMLAEYGDIDLVLDTTPYNGGMTTLEALWMGRPVVSLRGDSFIARQGAAILDAAGLQELVARDVRDFAAIVDRWTRSPRELGSLSAQLRGRLRASPLLDARGLARSLEAAYREAWQGWVRAGQ
ncbi:MAG: glycosyltransferase, partial [Bacillota bacterium]